jgi:hypothetical protein
VRQAGDQHLIGGRLAGRVAVRDVDDLVAAGHGLVEGVHGDKAAHHVERAVTVSLLVSVGTTQCGFSFAGIGSVTLSCGLV